MTEPNDNRSVHFTARENSNPNFRNQKPRSRIERKPKMLFPDDEYCQKSDNGFARAPNHKFTDSSERFTLKTRMDYQKQFAHIYSRRLNEMRSLLTEKAIEKWGKYSHAMMHRRGMKSLTDLNGHIS